jgi:RNA polymerase sigma-70 factor (family 1)
MFASASDTELVVAVRSGSHDALTEIFKRHWKPLYLAAVQKLKSHELAEEVVQDLFANLWEKREHLFNTGDVHLSAYLHRAIKNRVLNQLRKLVYDKKYWEHCQKFLPTSESNVEEMAEFNDLQEKLHGAIDQLSDKTREIFVLNKLKGVPVTKISQQLNLSEKAVGYHLTKSVKELMVQLRDFTT